MTEESAPFAPRAAMEELHDAKFSIPHSRPGAVSRAELIQSARSSDCRVVGVTAPAGYGKTTFLTQWAREEDRRVGWISLDRFDDDPAAMLTAVASAYARVTPGEGDLLAGIGSMSVLGRAAPRLAARLSVSPEPFVLMVDDLHELRSPECHDVLSVVISGIPHGSQLVATSRSEQPHLPRLRASGDVWELLASDLALDTAGAKQIFSQANVALTSEAAAAVTVRTEGWPVGLYLAALIAGDSSGDGLVAGDDRFIADYLYRETFAQLPEETQRFLRRSAVLEQLCASLCNAVLDESGANDRLRALEASSLFMVPLDRRREWYRYHALFREFLLGELRRIEPDLVTKLHLRAADWYEANGSPARSVEHLLFTSELDRCVGLVAELVVPTWEAGQISTIQRWLNSVGDPAIAAYPPLAVIAAWIALYTGQTAAAQKWAAFVDAASFDHVPLDGSASFDSARSMLRSAMCADGPEQMLVEAERSVADEPPWSPYRDAALVLYAEANLLTGDIDQAATLFTETSELATAFPRTDRLLVSEGELALLAIDRGRWNEAVGHSTRALTAIDEHRMDDYPTAGLAFAAGARLAMHRGDLKEMNRHLAAAMRVRPFLTFLLPIWAVRARLHLAKVYRAIGEQTTARHLLREIDDVLRQRPALGTLVDEVEQLRRTLASNESSTSGASPLTPAELRLLPYLQTHLAIRDIADRLFVSRNTVNSQVSSIYRKLGVSSRNEAVDRATSVGLLGG